MLWTLGLGGVEGGPLSRDDKSTETDPEMAQMLKLSDTYRYCLTYDGITSQ